jgi:hypothetical protein
MSAVAESSSLAAGVPSNMWRRGKKAGKSRGIFTDGPSAGEIIAKSSVPVGQTLDPVAIMARRLKNSSASWRHGRTILGGDPTSACARFKRAFSYRRAAARCLSAHVAPHAAKAWTRRLQERWFVGSVAC